MAVSSRGAPAILVVAALLDGLIQAQGVCTRDQVAECNCLMGCKVFGGSTAGCSGSELQILTHVDEVVASVLSKNKTRCEGIKCVMGCTKYLDCMDTEITGRCLNVVQQEEGCDVRCDDGSGAHRGAGSVGGAGLLLAALLGAATLGS
mmetsp:Transcript_66716/g.168320  ORF Transcript_66716/g.168320 Transcript_66716/m.168320 type:complete len:148 (-) Transcript_66716:179-622(-)